MGPEVIGEKAIFIVTRLLREVEDQAVPGITIAAMFSHKNNKNRLEEVEEQRRLHTIQHNNSLRISKPKDLPIIQDKPQSRQMNKLFLINIAGKIAIFQKKIIIIGFQGLTNRVDTE